ncbi:hypothetical protein [Blastococcus litoris]|uniref:hypothetical protein n=1 Tax=Blastococcus litoris TaxID=2171622 RepID=UPI0013E095B1|nr:hypothetical protein [Blastococcus litoris]
MTQRLQQPSGSGRRAPRRRAPRVEAPVSEPTILGFPAERAGDTAPTQAAPDVPRDVGIPSLTVVRRSEPFGAAALVLAGVAANVSLLLPWSRGAGSTGLTLVQRGGAALDAGLAESARRGVWEPLTVVLCGGLLVLLGFALLVPARAHRLLGVLALAVALAATAAALLLASEAGWRADRFGPGMWCAVAVPVLGLLGALKAMLTPPHVTVAGGATVS